MSGTIGINPACCFVLLCCFWHVVTHPHTQHLHFHTSVLLTKNREEQYLCMLWTTPSVRSCLLRRMVWIPLSWLQNRTDIFASSATLQTRAEEQVNPPRRSHSGKTQSRPLVFLDPGTGVVSQLTFNTVAVSSSYVLCVRAHVCVCVCLLI